MFYSLFNWNIKEYNSFPNTAFYNLFMTLSSYLIDAMLQQLTSLGFLKVFAGGPKVKKAFLSTYRGLPEIKYQLFAMAAP